MVQVEIILRLFSLHDQYGIDDGCIVITIVILWSHLITININFHLFFHNWMIFLEILFRVSCVLLFFQPSEFHLHTLGQPRHR